VAYFFSRVRIYEKNVAYCKNNIDGGKKTFIFNGI